MVKELEQRQKVRRAIYSWPSLVVVTALTVLLVKGAIGIFSIERESAGKVKDLEAQNEALVLREENLKEGIERLKTDEGRIEAIKDKFSAVREGEHVAIIVDERRKATTTEKEKKTWYQKFWNAIIKDQ